jgi:hypothetical protein
MSLLQVSNSGNNQHLIHRHAPPDSLNTYGPKKKKQINHSEIIQLKDPPQKTC